MVSPNEVNNEESSIRNKKEANNLPEENAIAESENATEVSIENRVDKVLLPKIEKEEIRVRIRSDRLSYPCNFGKYFLEIAYYYREISNKKRK